MEILKRDELAKIFWEGISSGRLLYQRCKVCKKAIFFPSHFCRFCLSEDLVWEESKGFGRIYSYTIVQRPPKREFEKYAPYIVGIIDLDEGFRMMANIKFPKSGIHELFVGKRVKLSFLERGGIKVPCFEIIE